MHKFENIFKAYCSIVSSQIGIRLWISDYKSLKWKLSFVQGGLACITFIPLRMSRWKCRRASGRVTWPLWWRQWRKLLSSATRVWLVTEDDKSKGYKLPVGRNVGTTATRVTSESTAMFPPWGPQCSMVSVQNIYCGNVCPQEEKVTALGKDVFKMRVNRVNFDNNC